MKPQYNAEVSTVSANLSQSGYARFSEGRSSTYYYTSNQVPQKYMIAEVKSASAHTGHYKRTLA